MPGIRTMTTADVEAGDAAGHWLEPGDFALVPHGRGHVLASAPRDAEFGA